MRIRRVSATWFGGMVLIVGCGGSDHGTTPHDGSRGGDANGGTAGASAAGAGGSGGAAESDAGTRGGVGGRNGDGGSEPGGAGGKASNGGGGGGTASGGAGGTARGGAGGGAGTAGSGASGIDPYGGGPMVAVASMAYELGTGPIIIMPRFPVASGASPPSCMPVRYGACIVDNCTRVDPNVQRLAAGVIRVDSADAGIHVAFDSNGTTGGDRAFAGGEMVTVSATGGDIPAFSVNMQVPLMLLVDQPTKPTLRSTTLAVAAPQDAPLKLSWTRGAPGVFLVVQSLDIQGFGALGSVNASCFFPSEVGSGTVPAEVLSDVMVGQQFMLLTANALEAPAGAQPVTVWIVAEALTPDKKANVVLDVQ